MAISIFTRIRSKPHALFSMLPSDLWRGRLSRCNVRHPGCAAICCVEDVEGLRPKITVFSGPDLEDPGSNNGGGTGRSIGSMVESNLLKCILQVAIYSADECEALDSLDLTNLSKGESAQKSLRLKSTSETVAQKVFADNVSTVGLPLIVVLRVHALLSPTWGPTTRFRFQMYMLSKTDLGACATEM